jgi:xylitol oxidase
VSALELVTADGDVRTLRRGEADFDGAVVGLGALGVVTKLTLDLVPAFDVAQFIYRRVPVANFIANYDAILASAYSASVFTNWQSEAFEQVWMKCLADRPHFDLTTIGGTPAEAAVHPIENVPGMPPFVGNDPEKSTVQCGVPGPWHARLPHFKFEHTPSSGEELQSEFFVPREHAAAAFAAIADLRDEIRPLIQVSELRVVAPDELWLSPYYRRPTVGIHFTWRRDPAGVAALVRQIEEKLAPFDMRPHWAKVFTPQPERMSGLYPKWNAFRDLVRRYDPNGKFRNPFMDRHGL